MEVVQWVAQAGPAVSAAVGAYGVAVLTRAQDAAADATVSMGQRIVQTVWRRGDESEQAELERAVSEHAEDPDDPDTVAGLRAALKRVLRDDAELREELAELFPSLGAGTVNVTASGERSIAAQNIGTAITGDGHAPRP